MFSAPKAAATLRSVSSRALESWLEAFDGPAYLLAGRDLTLKWFNSGYRRSWLIGGGRDEPSRRLDASILESISPQLSPFYRQLYREAARGRRCAVHRYSCPSPSANRWFQQVIVPRPEGLGIVNALLFEQTRPAAADRIQSGSVQCAHCRKVRAPEQRWAPNEAVYAADADDLPMELCEDCAEFYASGASAAEWLDV